MKTAMIVAIVATAIIAIAIAVGLASGYYTNSATATTIFDVCTVVSYSHSDPYNPDNNSSYAYTNSTSTSTLETYTRTNVQAPSSQDTLTYTGTTLTASGRPGIAWNETVCTFFKSIP